MILLLGMFLWNVNAWVCLLSHHLFQQQGKNFLQGLLPLLGQRFPGGQLDWKQRELPWS
jgi:hypothetical protein